MTIDTIPPRVGDDLNRTPQWHALGVDTSGRVQPLFVASRVGRANYGQFANAMTDLEEVGENLITTALRHLDGLAPISDRAEEVRQWWASYEGDGELNGQIEVLPLLGGNTAISYRPASGATGCAAWDEDCFAAVAVPAGLSEVIVVYGESEAAMFNRWTVASVLSATMQGGEPPASETSFEFETGVEWFSFLGEGTESATGFEMEPVQRGSRGGASFQENTHGRSGLLLLRGWQWAGSRLDRTAKDPLQGRRLRSCRNENTWLAQTHPEVWEAPDGQIENPVVWVHGTVSCGIDALPLLNDLHVPVYRYEHDTFLDIDRNGVELAETLARKRSAFSRVLLIGHSRGGLVARVAANHLKGTYSVPVTVVTLGTPHLGTPIVNVGARALSALAGMTKFGLGRVHDPATLLLKYLLKYVQLPAGILDMAVESGWLRGFNCTLSGSDAAFYLGADHALNSSGVKVLAKLSPLFTAQGHSENDLVVSVHSATAGKLGQSLNTPCGHFQYLENPEVRQLLRTLVQV